MGRFDFEGFARGWFVACFSDELAPGDVKPLRYFDQDLVLFRTASGAPKILDAFCPHMGAHLGHGGTVKGESIECPFHAWQFDGAGQCTDIPYAKKIPPRAKVECWPIVEKNGMVYVWHDPDKAAPTWQIPDLAWWGSPDWTGWTYGQLEVKTHPREIVENVVDVGHFIPVHGTHVGDISNVFDGHTAKQINSGTAYPIGGGKDDYSLEATYYGPGYQVTDMHGVLHSHLINAHTPIDEGTLLLRFAVAVKRADADKYGDGFVDTYIENLRGGFFQDIAIWEHMTFRDRPVLCDGDGPLIKLRKWYAQFYAPAAPAEGAPA